MPNDSDNSNYSSIFVNRELSWLKFNERVLEEAEDESLPAFERLRFLSIYESNLDEFFMVRVGSLMERLMIGDDEPDNKSGMHVSDQLSAIFNETRDLMPRKENAYISIMSALAAHGIERVSIASLDKNEFEVLRLYFETQLRPTLAPLIIDRHHPFPFLHGGEIYVVVELETKKAFVKLGIIPMNSAAFGHMYVLPGTQAKCRFILCEDILCYFADEIFKKVKIIDRAIVRVTRNADLDTEEALLDEEIDYRHAMELLVNKRRRLSPVRLQLSHKPGSPLLSAICERLPLNMRYTFSTRLPLDFSFVSDVQDRVSRGLPEIFFRPEQQTSPPGIDMSQPLIPQIMKKDLLLSYPYHSFRPFTMLLEDAADDKDVTSIKITLYRVAEDSSVTASLIRAAENGKEVCVVVELKARFDETNNISWSRRLEEAGCMVIYGIDVYKVHSKLLLITRRGKKGVEFITQIGTGNYNEKTARLYTDLSLFTANPEIGREASDIFGSLLLGEKPAPTKLLWVAPDAFRSRICEMIDREMEKATMGCEARIIIKCNGVSDKQMITKLSEASRANVKILMFVRGICCFRPGIPGHTDNITVKSIVGRLLEHSRIYVFGVGEDTKIFIASGDLLTRNTERRVEVGAPILDANIRAYILRLLELADSDNVKARLMLPSGNYIRVPRSNENIVLDSQREQFILNRRLLDEYNASAAHKSAQKNVSFFSRIFKKKTKA